MKALQLMGAVPAAGVLAFSAGLAASAPAHAASKGGVSVVGDRSCPQLGYSNPVSKPLWSGGPAIQVFYSRSQNKNCVMLLNRDGRGRSMGITASFKDTPAGAKTNAGYFHSYAGSLILDHRGRSGSARCNSVKGWATIGPKHKITAGLSGFCG